MGLGKLFCFESYSQLTCVLHSIFKIYFNWRSIILQHCDGPCHTSVCISHRYSCVPSILNPLPAPPPPYPPGCHRGPALGSLLHIPNQLWVPCFIYQICSGCRMFAFSEHGMSCCKEVVPGGYFDLLNRRKQKRSSL